MENVIDNSFSLPLIPLRGLTIYPGMLLTFEVERTASVTALNNAVNSERLIFLASQINIADDVPEESGIYHVGVVCRVRQQLRIPRGSGCRVMVEGLYRAEATHIETGADGYTAVIKALPDKKERVGANRLEALVRNALSLFEEYIHFNSERR